MNNLPQLPSRLTDQFLIAGKVTRYRLLAVVLIACCVLIFSAAKARAQTPNVQHTENRADQSMRGNFRVDPSTLGMSFSIPLGGYPGRAGNHVPVTLNYNSKLWRIEFDSYMPWLNQMRTWTRAHYAETSTSGWTSSLEIPYIEFTGRDQFYDTSGTGVCQFCESETGFFYIKRIHVHLSDGSAHELRTDEGAIPFDQQYPGGNFTGIFKAIDGSGMYFDSPANILYLPDGSRYFFSSTEVGIHGKMGLPATAYVDRNGNTLSFNIQNRSWSDTLGRPLYDPIPNFPPAPGEQTYTLPGIYLGGPTTLTYKLRWANLGNVLRVAAALRYTGDRKCTAQITQWSPALFQTYDTQTFLCAKLGAGGNPEVFNPVVLSELELPNGQKYQFKYNIYGEIEQVFLPTGGYERYQYGEIQGLSVPNQPYAQSNRGVTSRSISVDGTTETSTWQYSLVSSIPYIVRTTAPDASYAERVIIQGSTPQFQFPWGIEPITAGMVKEERAHASTGQMLRRSLTEWLVPGRPTKEISTILDTGGNALATTTTYQYDADFNVISTSKYDFASVNQSTAQTGDINSIPSGPVVRTEEMTFLVNDPNIDPGTKTAYRLRNLIALPTSTRLKNAAGTIVSQSEFKYDEATYPLLTYGAVVGWSDPSTNVRGLVTTTRNWLSTNGSWPETHAQYDQCGSPRKTWDARGYLSEMEYSSAFHRAYLTQSTSPDPDGGGAVTPLVTSAIYDPTSGVALSRTDANNKTTTFEYSAFDANSNPNPLQRLTRVIQPDGGSTAHAYSDTPGNVNVVTKTALDSSRYVQSTQRLDGLGRAWRSEKSEGATSIYVDTQYDQMGRTWKVSNPYRLGDTVVWTTTGYDALSRIVSVTTPDSAQVGTVYAGSTSGTLGFTVTVTDQTGKKRKSVTDALGRLREVYEDPLGLNYLTSYSYDPLDNLTQVSQGSQLRYFMYDSLKRLIRARNPEQDVHASLNLTDPLTGNTQWSFGYQYDSNGNLTQKTDARGVISTYGYDALNRNVFVIYSDGTPQISRVYDGAVNGKGRFWYDVSGDLEHTAIDTYDALGRVKNWRQHFRVNNNWSQGYYVSRNYDLAGNVTLQGYPSGRTANYSYDDAGRTSSFTGNLGDGVPRTYSTGIVYSPLGGMAKEQFGTDTPLYNKSLYNTRGQLGEIRVGTTYTGPNDSSWNRGAIINNYGCWGACSGPDNNGNLKRQEHWIPKEDQPQPTIFEIAIQEYEYDNLNRLSWVREVTGPQQLSRQTYVYDRYGNRTIHQTSTMGLGINKKDFSVNTATNRLGVPGGQTGTMSYDNAGNLTNDTYTGAGSRTYDAENRMTQAWGGNNQWQVYSYNADGQRVRRKVDGVETWQIYGMDGELLAEYPANGATASPQKEYGYRNGQLLVTAEAPAGAGTNVALASNGGVAVASSTTSPYFPASVTDGLRRGINNSVWADSTYTTFPDWIEVDFNGSKTISEINVVTQQDDYQNPVEPTLNQTFSLYGITAFDVQYWNGSAWATVPGGSVTGNNKVWRQFIFSPITTSKIRVVVNSGADNTFSRVVEVEAWVASPVNFALASNGGVAVASSTTSPYFPASVTDGLRRGINNSVWADSTYTTFPDWIEVDFNGSKTISEINVVTQQDDYQNPVEPTLNQTFSLYGITAFDVQYWNGSAWATVPGGSVTGNNKVWRQFIFSPITTSKIRVVVNSGADNTFSRVVEVEAWGSASSGGAGANINWLVADQLGTPRIVIDKTGSLANVKRHDYLPFGEELYAGQGVRTTALGYTGDTIRQKFTSKERDFETNLDYFLARYYSSTQGRFTSPDEFNGGPVEASALGSGHPEKQALPYADITNPQSLNKYQYSFNNPLRYVDLDGHDPQDPTPQSSGIVQRIIDDTTKIIGSLLRNFERARETVPEETERRGPVSIGDEEMQRYVDAKGKALQHVSDGAVMLDFTGLAGAVRGLQTGNKSEVAVGTVNMGAAIFGPFGRAGSASARAAVGLVGQAGTHEAIKVGTKSIVPTRQVAEKLIAAAGGVIQRVEKAHKGVGHPYPHINYITSAGEKATIRVQSVGKQFYRSVRKFVE